MPKGVYLRKPFTSEHKRNLRYSHLGKELGEEHKANISKALLGHLTNEETKKKIGLSHQLVIRHTPEAAQKTSNTVRQLWQDPEYRERMSQAHKEHIHSEEQKHKISISTKEALLSPEINTKLREALRKNWQSEELRERHRQIFAGRIIYWKDKLPRGEQHHNWNGGTSYEPYSSEFNYSFKEAIKERDNYTCQLCGIREGADGWHLGIHHIDYNKKYTTQTNSITLLLLNKYPSLFVSVDGVLVDKEVEL